MTENLRRRVCVRSLRAAIYGAKSRFASPKLDSRVVIGDQTTHLQRLYEDLMVLSAAHHDIHYKSRG
jgi:hypothetical protein